MEFLQDSVTSKLSPRHVCREIDTTRIPFLNIFEVISNRISNHENHRDSHSILTSISFYAWILVPSFQEEPFHRDPLTGCARRRSATAKLVLGIAWLVRREENLGGLHVCFLAGILVGRQVFFYVFFVDRP